MTSEASTPGIPILNPVTFADIGLYLAVALLAVACAGQPKAPPQEPLPAPLDSATSDQALVSTSTAASGGLGPTNRDSTYDPDATMFSLFVGRGHPEQDTLQGLEDARRHRDTSQVPVIIELLRFVRSPNVRAQAIEVLRDLTGAEFHGEEMEVERRWREWLGARLADFSPLEEYLDWKIRLLSQVDVQFADLLAPAAKGTRLDLVEIEWGRVRPDAIPPLESPKHIPASQAGYLEPDDRVFGVSINGEHRAYPLRIMNGHEMANDVLGGEPISLAY